MAREKQLVNFAGLDELKWDEDAFYEACQTVCYYFKVEKLLKEQITVLKNLLKGNNVYFSAPTGFGKSLIFQSIPLIADHLPWKGTRNWYYTGYFTTQVFNV